MEMDPEEMVEYYNDIIEPEAPPEEVAKRFFRRYVADYEHIDIVLMFERYLMYKPDIVMKEIPNGHELVEICNKNDLCPNPRHHNIATKMKVSVVDSYRPVYIPCLFLYADSDLTGCSCYNNWCTSCFVDMAMARDLFSCQEKICPHCQSIIRLDMFKHLYYYSVPRKRQGRNKGSVNQQQTTAVKSENSTPPPQAAAAKPIKIYGKRKKLLDQGV